MGKLATWVMLPLIGALLAYVLIPNEPIVYSEVIVPARAIEVREPPAREPTIVERIRFVSIPPRQVATAIGAGAADVSAFCAPLVASRADTAHVMPPPVLLLRSGTHSPGWFWGKDQLLLTGPTSHGDLRALDYHVRPGFDFRTSGDSVLVRYPRPALVREGVEFGLPLLIGAMFGRFIW